VPAVVAHLLQLLREADRGGRWPHTGKQMRADIENEGGDGFMMGSFSGAARGSADRGGGQGCF
jgi:hypothetical protein